MDKIVHDLAIFWPWSGRQAKSCRNRARLCHDLTQHARGRCSPELFVVFLLHSRSFRCVSTQLDTAGALLHCMPQHSSFWKVAVHAMSSAQVGFFLLFPEEGEFWERPFCKVSFLVPSACLLLYAARLVFYLLLINFFLN